MRRTFLAATAALLLTATVPVLAAGMNMSGAKPMGEVTQYRFVLAGPPKSGGSGKSIVSVKLLHDGNAVVGAIVFQSRADMGPIGMAAMTAPIKPLGEQPPGVYRFEVENGHVWQKPDNWSLGFSAKVRGVAQTVTGGVTVKLTP